MDDDQCVSLDINCNGQVTETYPHLEAPVVYLLSSQEIDTATQVKIQDWFSHGTFGTGMDPVILLLCPFGWDDRIHRLLLNWEIRQYNECPAYYTEQSEVDVSVMLWWPLLPLLPGSLWPEELELDKVLSMYQTELNHIYQPLRSAMIWHKVNF